MRWRPCSEGELQKNIVTKEDLQEAGAYTRPLFS